MVYGRLFDRVPLVQVVSFDGGEHSSLQGESCHGDGQLLNVRRVLHTEPRLSAPLEH